MSYIIAVLAGTAGAAIGWVAAVSMMGSTTLLDLTARFPFLPPGPGPIGSFVGFLLTAVATFYFRPEQKRFWPALLRGTVLTLVFAVAAAGALRARQGALDYFAINYPEPTLSFEIRLPAEASPPRDQTDVQIALHTDRNQSLATFADRWLRREGGRLVLSGEVSLYFRTVERVLVLSIPGEPNRIFQLRLPQSPPSLDHFGAWWPVDFIGEPEGALRPPSPDDGFEIRYRVDRGD